MESCVEIHFFCPPVIPRPGASEFLRVRGGRVSDSLTKWLLSVEFVYLSAVTDWLIRRRQGFRADARKDMSPPMATRHAGTVRHAERELRRASLHLLLSAVPLIVVWCPTVKPTFCLHCSSRGLGFRFVWRRWLAVSD